MSGSRTGSSEEIRGVPLEIIALGVSNSTSNRNGAVALMSRSYAYLKLYVVRMSSCYFTLSIGNASAKL